jgi:dihydropyrimidinase
MSSDAELFEALEVSRRTGALICVHAESGGIIDMLTARCRGSVRGMKAHRLSRPPFTEWEAVGRALVLAGSAGGKIYFVHLSSGVSARLLSLARGRGVRAAGETCPQYLVLDDSVYGGRNGHLFATCPPVRSLSDSLELWKNLKDGGISVAATDSCAFTRAQKDAWNGDIERLPMGIPGTQTLLPLLYTFGVRRGRLTLAGLTRALSLSPARIMGLYPRKGAIRPGADADLTLIDPSAPEKADFRRLKHNSDYSAYQGMKLYGWARLTLLRGEVIARNGELVRPGRPGGRFLKRNKSLLV